jgi:hypothetical protein
MRRRNDGDDPCAQVLQKLEEKGDIASVENMLDMTASELGSYSLMVT